MMKSMQDQRTQRAGQKRRKLLCNFTDSTLNVNLLHLLLRFLSTKQKAKLTSAKRRELYFLPLDSLIIVARNATFLRFGRCLPMTLSSDTSLGIDLPRPPQAASQRNLSRHHLRLVQQLLARPLHTRILHRTTPKSEQHHQGSFTLHYHHLLCATNLRHTLVPQLLPLLLSIAGITTIMLDQAQVTSLTVSLAELVLSAWTAMTKRLMPRVNQMMI